MSPLREQLLQTTKAFLEAFNEFTPEAVVRNRSPTCTHRIFPATLKLPATSNAEYGEFVGLLKHVMPVFEMRLAEGQEPVVDEVARKVSLYTKSRSETKVGLYENEYFWVLTMNEDGTLIEDVLEFPDSLYTSEWIPKLRDAALEAAKK
ncbi:hypothetical protein F4821DRAFT_22447 [Hypoxylon rubiginosum]|uniref:Uncharacterized protein n=1 Tax=Hypoxylon rubiginosum TaxID=110542 RepID=A0ACC0DDP9_9PEZI|nr:hypothetical protein F4821DRAFT_22447 [Hypoxylon rubiginosum]